MQTLVDPAERARRNGLLTLALFATSFGVLALMVTLVFAIRSGALGRLIEPLARAIGG